MEKPGLYIVSTPIGNLGDITLRALDVLKNCDVIFCEDTRVSGKLMSKYQINKTLLVYNDKSDHKVREKIMNDINSGKKIALISDAGTPLISDPGYKLVRSLKESGYFVDVIPGVSAPITALSLSALPSNRFNFIGFLPKTVALKTKIFQEFSNVNSTLIAFDSPERIIDSIEIAIDILGDRIGNISRELTKLFQESKTAKLSELVKYYKKHKPKGEIVFLISSKSESVISSQQIKQEIYDLLSLGNSAKDTTNILFRKYQNHFTKSEIYKICNLLKDKLIK